ncbi:hypothetical protein GCM10008014_23580 [Paenibacillus silvae]|uniref:DUF2268 domain-containing protein n=1 Tax=Paenibacillus silvae TaxID=1325358 RepID=A0ABQ1ZC04_9BACL|nr:hypothetical protein [Paenibacillus silvae]GGH54666.1 hypothetical protein GCM10008014_23580 [Paenibacillus silvae]
MHTFLQQINELNELQRELVSLHPFFAEHHPVVVADEALLHIYDYSSKTGQYEWAKTVPDDLYIPDDCLAAMPVHHLNNRMCAIVTASAFKDLEQKVFLFHEYVHCSVYGKYEERIVDCLRIKHKMNQLKRVTWEIDYEFPYEDETIAERIHSLLLALKSEDFQLIQAARTALFESLTEEQAEYWSWLEWNEGYARYVENLIRAKYNLKPNHYGDTAPYNRLVFYECGSEYIRLLVKEQPAYHTDLEQLFDRMQMERLAGFVS